MCCERKKTLCERLSLDKQFHAHGVVQIFIENNREGYFTISDNSDFLNLFVSTIYIFQSPEDDTENGLQFEIA